MKQDENLMRQQKFLKPKFDFGVILFMKRTDLPISSPCSAQWDTMTVRGRALFCDQCQTLVHDLSRLQRREAADFLQAHVGEQICVKYSYDALGHVLFAAPVQATVIPASMLRPSMRALAAATALVGARLAYDNTTGVAADASAPGCNAEYAPESKVPLSHGPANAPNVAVIPVVPNDAAPAQPSLGTGIGQSYGSSGGSITVSNSYALHALAAARPNVKVMPAHVSRPGLDRAIIRRLLKRHADEITHCYQQRLLVTPDVQGTVTATFTISAAGAVVNVTATGVDAEVAQCVAEVIRTIEFPTPHGGDLVVRVPLRLRIE